MRRRRCIYNMDNTTRHLLHSIADNKYRYCRQNVGSIRAEILSGGWGSDLTASSLLVNLVISQTQSNIKMCAYTLTDDSTKLILARNGSIMPGLSDLTRILTNCHIFACSSHIAKIFTYTETSLSPLSYYVHSKLLCCPSLMGARLCLALLSLALMTLQRSSSHQLLCHTTTPWRCCESGFF